MVDTAIFQRMEEKMKKSLEAIKKEFATIRTGRASPAILERITVEAYGTELPLKQVASTSAPEPRLLVIQAFDKSTVPSIEKSILKSDLGLTPAVDGNLIRLPIPPLTEERRRELVKMIKKKIEEGKVAIRNIRRDAIDEIKDQEKNHEIPEDESKRAQEQVQKVTDRYIKELDETAAFKEKEIMEV